MRPRIDLEQPCHWPVWSWEGQFIALSLIYKNGSKNAHPRQFLQRHTVRSTQTHWCGLDLHAGPYQKPASAVHSITDWFQTFPCSALLPSGVTACPHHRGSDTLRGHPADGGRSSLVYMLELSWQWQHFKPKGPVLRILFPLGSE